MIIEFKVKNYLSFKAEQILSFEATSDKYMQDYYCIDLPDGERLLRFAMIYGANASGKTNILLALDFLRQICVHSNERGQETGFIPFKFDENTKNEPGYFEIALFINNIKYIYSVSLDSQIIYEEKLVFYPGTQPALVFERKYNTDNDDFILKTGSRVDVDTVELSVLKSNTLNNMTIISGMRKTNINFQELNTVFDWFYNQFDRIIRPWNDLYRETVHNISNGEEDYKQFILENLEIADFNIKNIDVVYEDPSEYVDDYSSSNMLAENHARYYRTKVYFTHEINGQESQLSIDLQSSGTLRYMGLLGRLKEAIVQSKILNIDELEDSLHPDLVNHFINSFLFYSKKENSQSQFIFTTHNINLLAEDFIRKDIVWFTEKDEQGSTKLFSLDDFNIRKNLSFLNAYKAGKFGAVPNIGIL